MNEGKKGLIVVFIFFNEIKPRIYLRKQIIIRQF